MRRLKIHSLGGLLFVLATLFSSAPLARAATITVNSPAQRSAATSGVCTLGAAIVAANTNAPVDGCAAGSAGVNTIVVPAGIYTLTVPDNFQVSGPNGLPIMIGSNITIQGAGAATTIIERAPTAPAFRIFDTRLGFLGLNDVTVRGGNGLFEGGGAVLIIQSSVIVNNSVFSNNTGQFAGAALSTTNNVGCLTVNNSTFTDNTLEPGGIGGGAIEVNGSLEVNGSTFTGNTADFGGGIHFSGAVFCTNQAGTAVITNSTFSGNTARSFGGAINNRGSMTITRSVFSSTAPGAPAAPSKESPQSF